MSWNKLISVHRSPTIAIARWLGRALRKDSSRFMERYPVLGMTPDEAYSEAIKRILKKLPEHVPIAAKLAMAVTLLICAGMVGLGILIGANQTRLLDQQTAILESMIAQQVAESVKEPLLAGDAASLDIIAAQIIDQDKIFGTALFTDDKKIINSAGILPNLKIVKNSPVFDANGKTTDFHQIADETNSQESYISFVQPILHKDITVGYVLLSFDRSLLTNAKRQTIHMVATTTIAMIIFGIMASLVLGNRMTRPINELIKISREIVNGNYNFPVQERRKDEIGMLMESMNTMGRGLLRKEQVEKVFSQYVSNTVANKILDDLDHVENTKLGGHHVNASVAFADIVGFTQLSESMPPQEVSQLLNLYFTYIDKAVQFCNGYIDKYIGDCVMIVFGVPKNNSDHTYNAACCAWMINKLVEKINRHRASKNQTTIQLRIGINSGTMIAGNMGSSERMDYTVVGDAVNLASRLSHEGQPEEIIMTEEVILQENLFDRIATETLDTIKIRGKKLPISIHKVIDINPIFRKDILQEIDHILRNTPLQSA